MTDINGQLPDTRPGALSSAQDDPQQQNGLISTHHPNPTPGGQPTDHVRPRTFPDDPPVNETTAPGDQLPRPQDDGDMPAVPQHLRHRQRSLRRRRRKRSRPGAFFKHNRAFVRWRKRYNPYHLGGADWILWRASASPFRSGSYRDQAYERGYADAKREMPKPKMPRITHFLNGGK